MLETLYGEVNLRRIDDAFDTAFRHTGAQATVKPVARFTSIGYRLWQLPNGAGQQDFVIDVVRGASVSGPQGYNLPTQGTGLIPLADSGPVFGLKFDSYSRSDPSLNNAGMDLLVTFEIVGNAGRRNNVIGNYVLAWEAAPINDTDYQDVVYELSGAVPIPEPGAWAMAAWAAVGSAGGHPLRRRIRSTVC